jgi:hypothetical protein
VKKAKVTILIDKLVTAAQLVEHAPDGKKANRQLKAARKNLEEHLQENGIDLGLRL